MLVVPGRPPRCVDGPLAGPQQRGLRLALARGPLPRGLRGAHGWVQPVQGLGAAVAGDEERKELGYQWWGRGCVPGALKQGLFGIACCTGEGCNGKGGEATAPPLQRCQCPPLCDPMANIMEFSYRTSLNLEKAQHKHHFLQPYCLGTIYVNEHTSELSKARTGAITEGNNQSRCAKGPFWGMEAKHTSCSSSTLTPQALPTLSAPFPPKPLILPPTLGLNLRAAKCFAVLAEHRAHRSPEPTDASLLSPLPQQPHEGRGTKQPAEPAPAWQWDSSSGRCSVSPGQEISTGTGGVIYTSSCSSPAHQGPSPPYEKGQRALPAHAAPLPIHDRAGSETSARSEHGHRRLQTRHGLVQLCGAFCS